MWQQQLHFFPSNDAVTGHNAPLLSRPEDYGPFTNYSASVYDTVEHYLSEGAPAEKVVLGMPAYGRGFHLFDADYDGLNCPADDGMRHGSSSGLEQRVFVRTIHPMQAVKRRTFESPTESGFHKTVGGLSDNYVAQCLFSPNMHVVQNSIFV